MRNKLSITVLAFFAIWLYTMTGCNYDQYLPEDVPVIVDSVYFADDILPIFNADCNTSGCHNTGGTPPDLSPGNAYDALINGNFIDVSTPENSELYKWMRGEYNLPMPLTGPDPDYNALILAWITQGAKNN